MSPRAHAFYSIYVTLAGGLSVGLLAGLLVAVIASVAGPPAPRQRALSIEIGRAHV